jgi:hypothetical protein
MLAALEHLGRALLVELVVLSILLSLFIKVVVVEVLEQLG